MIQNYEIKYKNNEEILYIYLDFNTEFAKLKNKKNKLKKEIKKYIKKNNINFKGTTVAIIVGGIMLGTIMIKNPKYNDVSLNKNYTISLINKDHNNIQDNKTEKEPNEKETLKTEEQEKIKLKEHKKTMNQKQIQH